MWSLGGVLGAGGSGVLVWLLVTRAAANLPPGLSIPMVIVLTALGLCVGFLGGSAVSRRAGKSRHDLVLYSCVTGAFCGGLIGAFLVLAVTAGYLTTYAGWPTLSLDGVLMAVAYPLFALSGAGLGALCGAALGLAGGGLLRVLSPAR